MTDNASFPSALGRYGLLAALLLFCLGHPAAARPIHQYRMPIGAFLRRPAHGVPALTRQLADDRMVCIRYARLFHMSPPMVRRAFGTLRLTRLKQDRVLQVFYIHSGERIGYRLRRVRKGTLVYVLPDGTPLLLRLCGNPIHKTLPTQPQVHVPEFAPYEPPPASTFSLEETPPLRLATLPDFVEVEVAAPNHLPTYPGVLPAAASAPLANWAWGVVPVIVGSLGGFSGGSSPSPPPILPPASPPPPGPPVPENSAAILIVTGGATGLLLFKFHRRG